jgi:DnaJ-class molecular chaperone
MSKEEYSVEDRLRCGHRIAKCSTCQGEGYVFSTVYSGECYDCDGKGYKWISRMLGP